MMELLNMNVKKIEKLTIRFWYTKMGSLIQGETRSEFYNLESLACACKKIEE